MAKDPAVLFYTNDFLSGTFTMSDEQVGKYIRLLCLQHQKGGYLTEKDMLKICNTYDEDIFSKFEKDGDRFFNKRMSDEISRRQKYSESRRNNRKTKETDDIAKTYDTTYVKHMETENETENKNSLKENVPALFIKRWNRPYKNNSELQLAEKLVLEFGYKATDDAFRIAGERGDKTSVPYVRGILNKDRMQKEAQGKSQQRFTSPIMEEMYGKK